jgi:hypothetical protein
LNGWKYLASQNDSFTHVKVCTQMRGGQPSVCTTSDFHAVLFWFVYDNSTVRRPILTIGVSLERKITWLSTGENIFENIKEFRSYDQFNTTT